MKNPEISVVVSTYNRVKLLKRAIKSIQAQTYRDYEIIIVDDASDDSTAKYCKKLEKKEDNVKYIQRKTNWGKHGKPKNEGIKAAKGTYVAFLDDDNEYLPDHLQALHNEFINNPMLDVVYGDRWVIDSTGKQQKALGPHSNFDPYLLAQRNYIDTSDVLCKRDALLEVGGWDEELVKFADWNLWVRMAKALKLFKRVPKPLTNYYVHAGMNQIKHRSKADARTGMPLPTFEPQDCLIWGNQSTFQKKNKDIKIAVFTLTYDRLEYTKKMFESLKNNAGYDYDHFVIDNASQDKTVEWLKENKEEYNIKKIIENKENAGISKGSNQALDAIGDKYDVIIKIDNDCYVETENILQDIAEIYARSKQLVVGPNVEGLIDNAGGVPRKDYGYINNYLIGFVPHLGGIFVAAASEAYRRFRWKEDDFLHGMQDVIFSQFCGKVGLMMAYLENHTISHIDSTDGQKDKYPEYFKRRKEEKITKYKNEEV